MKNGLAEMLYTKIEKSETYKSIRKVKTYPES